MKPRYTSLLVFLSVIVLAVTAGPAHALTIENLKGQGLQDLYGTYAPGGDCQREPRVTIDDSGFAYAWQGKTVHSGNIVLALTFMGQDYHGISHFFFSFPLSDNDYGRVQMTANPDERAGILKFEPNLGPGESMTALQAALVAGSPYARCGARAAAAPSNAAVTSTAAPAKVEDDIKPNPAQIAAIRRAATGVADCKRLDQDCFSLSLADVNGDGRPDLLVVYSHATELGVCGTTGCGGVIILATAHGYADNAIELPRFNGMNVLAGTHHGMHDLQFDGDSPIWRWNGKAYALAKADLPGAGAQPWQTRQAAGRTLAMTVPIDSVIKTLSVFCNQGTPVLAMLVKARPPAGPVALTFVFRGWTVNVPMSQGNGDATLWMADLSGSDLPQWLAHRGSSPTTSELARLADMAFLRINGGMQGEISLKGSTAATQAALSDCYRY